MGSIAAIFSKRIPLFISFIFHPLLMPSLGVYIVLDSGTVLSLLSPVAQKIIMIAMITGTLAMPMAFLPFYFFRQLTKVSDETKRHLAPIMVAALFYYLVFRLFGSWGAPRLIQSFLIALIVNACLLVVLLKRYDVSVYMNGIGVVMGLIFVLIFKYGAHLLFYLMIVIFIAGSLASARLSLNKHNPSQVYGGLLLGIVITSTLLMLL
ncbi:MAG: hypothetical protein Q8928_17605 [Bacteroidota bacterium]|nr:hypothetical protein [Bacteroidota bacterium]